MTIDSAILQQERWVDLRGFPGYSLSDWGRVLNNRTNCFVTVSVNNRGAAMVGLMKDRVQHKRSLALLVAEEFVHPGPNSDFNTPINLDGDRLNNHYTNLMFRPLWFARKYSIQFTDSHSTILDPIEDVETHIVYENSMAAAIAHGLLDVEIYLSMTNNTYVWPTGQVFRLAN